MYLALGVGMIAVYLSLTLEVGKLVPVLAVLYVALVLRRLIMNRADGFRLSQNRIDWFTPKGNESAPLEALSSVAIGRSQGGDTVCVLNLSDGRTASLSGVEHLDPKQLVREFGIRGIPVQA